jgi:hypothetical protein
MTQDDGVLLPETAKDRGCSEAPKAPKFAHLEAMDAKVFKAMVLRSIAAFDREPLDKTRPYGMAAAALFICHGAAEANASAFNATLEGCSIRDADTGDWQITVKRLRAPGSEKEAVADTKDRAQSAAQQLP